MNLPTFIPIALIFLSAGFIQGMTGFGSALVAMPLLCLIVDVKLAVPLCILNSVIITTYLVFNLRHHFDKGKILPLCLGSIPGIWVGATLLKEANSALISLLLGLLLIGYSLYSLFFSPKPRTLHPAWSLAAGFSSGAIGAAFSAGGPPTLIYTTLNDWNRHEIKATLSGFFLFNSYLTAVVHIFSGLTTAPVLQAFAISAPFVLTGTILGSLCYKYVNKTLYLKIIFSMLIIMGLLMVFGI